MTDLKIIDAHGHIGDILYPGGGSLICKTGIAFPRSFLEWLLCERVLYKETFFFRTAEKAAPYWSVKEERKRNAAATLENLRKSLDVTSLNGANSIANIEIAKCVCAPVAPNVTYDDLQAAAQSEPRIIAFTSPDFSLSTDRMTAKLAADLADGAMGVKIHPIIQEIEADSALVMTALETVSAHMKSVPVLLHAGPSRYYLPKEGKTRFIDNASIERIERLISAFPQVNFIVGHAGLDDFRTTIAVMPKHKNTYIDTSFQYPQSIRELLSAFGNERVMFASDWHYGMRKPAIKTVMEACGDDVCLRQAVFHDNAAALMRITV